MEEALGQLAEADAGLLITVDEVREDSMKWSSLHPFSNISSAIVAASLSSWQAFRLT